MIICQYLEVRNIFQYIFNGLYRPQNNGFAPKDKWLALTNMGRIIVTCYNKGMTQLEKLEIDISKSFCQIRGQSPLNPNNYIMCLGLIPNHFVHVLLKDGYPISHLCMRSGNYTRKKKLRHENNFVFIDNFVFKNSCILKE